MTYAALTVAELAAAISGGAFNQSGSFAPDMAPCVSDFYVFKGTSADGELSLRYDCELSQLTLTVRGVAVLSTTALGSNPAAPTLGNWSIGDSIEWRAWYDPAGGSRSMGIRWLVNRCGGNDTTGTASGSALAALSSAQVVGSVSGASLVTAARTADLAARGVVLGDSICAPRLGLPALGTLLGSRAGAVVASLAQGGATANNQLATWQASRHRADAGVVWVAIQVGINDIAAGDNAATVIGDVQALVNDVNTNNPSAVVVLCQVLPARFYLNSLGSSHYGVWQSLVEAIAGNGGTPVTGVDARVTTLVSTLGDGNDNLLHHIDNLHTSARGRVLNAAAIASALTSLGVL